MLTGYYLDHLGSILTKFGFAAVVSPVSGAEQAKSDDFDTCLDLDLTCDLHKKILKFS